MDTTKVNWAEIADKILDQGGSLIMSAIEQIKEIAPYIWEITQTQVIAEATLYLCVLVFFLVVSSVVTTVGLIRGSKDDWDNGFNVVMAGVGGFCLLISVFIGLIDGQQYILMLMNPDWYTIQRIVEMSKGIL